MAQGIAPDRPTRVIELIFTGSPIGKRYALDDASQDLTLLIQDEDECLSSVLDRHVAEYSKPQWHESALLSPLPIEIRCMTAAIAALSKVLLYLNLPEAEQRRITERGDLEKVSVRQTTGLPLPVSGRPFSDCGAAAPRLLRGT
ncbi:MAG: hypothetical protein EOM91_16515, partial [Sphingobacteriia bacterium]|nr:hypothetical protein [Sphingobacteriia bacterium]NCC41212.1 hypothetical protein [Gammaproteobacteria bacterium]